MAALRGKVLLVDGQARHRRLTSAMMTEMGLEVSNTGDADSAVALALTGHFELVLIDLTIPVLDGIEAGAKLRAAGYARPVVALTAPLVAAEQTHYLARGFSHCLCKPLDSAALAAQLGSLLAPAPAGVAAAREPVLLDMAVLCALFAARLPVQVQQMQALAARHEWRAVSRIAHFVKGAGASFNHAVEGELAARLDAAIGKGEHALALAALIRLAERVGLPP